MIFLIPALLLNVSYIEAGKPFNAQWAPLVNTVNYRIMIDGEQIGADYPAFFPTNVNWVFQDAQAGMHTFEVLSINAAGQATPVEVTLNGQKPGPSFKSPSGTSLKRIVFAYRRNAVPDL